MPLEPQFCLFHTWLLWSSRFRFDHGLSGTLRTGDKAQIAGLELEVRKNILDNNLGNSLLSTGFNVSYMYTEQDLFSTVQGIYSTSFNRKTEQLQGASPLLINADLNFKPNYYARFNNKSTRDFRS